MAPLQAITFTLIALSSLLLSGCADLAGDFTGNGATHATETATKDCSDGKGRVRVETNGDGKIAITVKDAAGQVIFTKNIDGAGQNHADQEISGSPGTWTLRAAFGSQGVTGSRDFVGQWNIGLSC